MAVTSDIVESYRAPRRVLRRQLDSGIGEERALAYVMIACFLFFISQLPDLSRQVVLDPSGLDLTGRAAGAFVGAVLFAPLLFYALAAVSHLLARLFGGAGTWLSARLALFWALLAVSPLVLLRGLVDGFIGQGQTAVLGSLFVALAFLAIWFFGLYEAERTQKAGDNNV